MPSEQPKNIVPPQIVKKEIHPPKHKTCAWCALPCDESVRAIRSVQLSFITDGLAETGERQQQVLNFCSRQHRVNYFYEM